MKRVLKNNSGISRRWRYTICAALAFLLPAATSIGQRKEPAKRDIQMDGILKVAMSGMSKLQTADAAVSIAGSTAELDATFQDVKIDGRHLRVVGRYRADGVLEVLEFYILKDGQPFRLVYFCAICNITSFAPGNCDCCQEPTRPMEISPSDPRVRYDEIRAVPPLHRSIAALSLSMRRDNAYPHRDTLWANRHLCGQPLSGSLILPQHFEGALF